MFKRTCWINSGSASIVGVIVAPDFDLDTRAFGLRLDAVPRSLATSDASSTVSKTDGCGAREVEQLPNDARDAFGLIANDRQVALSRLESGRRRDGAVVWRARQSPAKARPSRAPPRRPVCPTTASCSLCRSLRSSASLSSASRSAALRCSASLIGHPVEFLREARQLAAARPHADAYAVIQIAAPDRHGAVEQFVNGPRQVVPRHHRHDQQNGDEQQQRRDQNVKAGARNIGLDERD